MLGAAPEPLELPVIGAAVARGALADTLNGPGRGPGRIGMAAAMRRAGFQPHDGLIFETLVGKGGVLVAVQDAPRAADALAVMQSYGGGQRRHRRLGRPRLIPCADGLQWRRGASIQSVVERLIVIGVRPGDTGAPVRTPRVRRASGAVSAPRSRAAASGTALAVADPGLSRDNWKSRAPLHG